jgi:hypothetical protein
MAKLKMSHLGLIEPVHGRYWKVQSPVNSPLQRLKQNSTFKHKNVEIWNLEKSTDVFIRWLSWDL